MKNNVVTALMIGLLPLAPVSLQAQDKADRQQRIEQFNKRFSEADVNGDGQLTKVEAQSKMPGVAANFDDIDADKKGYVTKQDIARSLKKMAERKAAKAGG